jgi:hypothetical protein
VPSRSKVGLYHLADRQACDCQDFKRHNSPCMHVLAVRLHCELVKASAPRPRANRSAKPAAPAPADRGVVLTMRRESDGTLSWERSHDHARPAADVAMANRYDQMFGEEPAF